MHGAVIIAAFLAFIAWLIYQRNRQKAVYLQSKEAYLKDILSRYPTAEALEKLLHSDEWNKLMEAYGKPPESNNRLLVLAITCLGILVLCVAGASAVLAMKFDGDMFFPAVILGAIGAGLLINAAIISYHVKKWKL